MIAIKKIPGNKICPKCNSGNKYKDCCGKINVVYPSTSIFIGEKPQHETDFDKNIFNKYGHYPGDYIEAIKENLSYENLCIYIDESYLKYNTTNEEFFSIGGFLIKKEENLNHIKTKLTKLIEKYEIDTIHFTDIIGGKQIADSDIFNFLAEYSSILENFNAEPFSVCMNKKEIIEWIGEPNLTVDQCFQALTWKLIDNMFMYAIWKFGHNLTVEIWREEDSVNDEKRILHQINIRGMLEKYKPFNISIYRHYMNFMKRSLLYSSLSDFIAYITTRIVPHFITGEYSKESIIIGNKDLLLAFNRIFPEHKFLKSQHLDEALSKIVKN